MCVRMQQASDPVSKQACWSQGQEKATNVFCVCARSCACVRACVCVCLPFDT